MDSPRRHGVKQGVNKAVQSRPGPEGPSASPPALFCPLSSSRMRRSSRAAFWVRDLIFSAKPLTTAEGEQDQQHKGQNHHKDEVDRVEHVQDIPHHQHDVGEEGEDQQHKAGDQPDDGVLHAQLLLFEQVKDDAQIEEDPQDHRQPESRKHNIHFTSPQKDGENAAHRLRRREKDSR